MKKKNSKKKGKGFEKKVEKCIASGAIWFDKGDLRTDQWVIECKYTDKKSFRITLSLLEKLWDEALSANKFPKLIIGIPRNDKEIFFVNCNIELQRK